jgi:MinD-like ATPase involved in chromosome partitioning or flagellar assembly
VLIACWSSKGGSGTTVVSATLALLLARSSPGDVLLADLAGDIPVALGMPDPGGPGLRQWLAAPDADATALARLETSVDGELSLLAAGADDADAPQPGRADELLAALAADPRPVIADCGVVSGQPSAGRVLAAGAGLSLLVLRPCYLAIRRALAAPIRPSGVILVNEERRSLGRRDIEDVLGVPVRAEIACADEIARAVDAGLLAAGLPRLLERVAKAAA